MKSLLCLSTLAVVALAAPVCAQKTNDDPAKPQSEITKAMYLVAGLH